MSFAASSFFLDSPPRPENPTNFTSLIQGPNTPAKRLFSNTSNSKGPATPGWVIEEPVADVFENDISIDLEPLNVVHADLAKPTTSRAPIVAYSFSGKPVYLKRKPKTPKAKSSVDLSSARGVTGLLDVPVHRMMDTIAREASLKLDSITNAINALSKPEEEVEHQLWTDKYRPQRFTDLMGDERVNREIMSWVKEWDACVFPEKRVFKKKKPAEDQEPAFVYHDDYNRPREKILLLSGPPGLGKTTLAHVVAQQAGYSVMEINASDARSGQVVEERLRPALEAGSGLGSKKPTLVVIDEIDGATGGSDNNSGFIQKLVSLTFDKPKRKGRSAGKKDGRRPLLRPIICICNDLYASSLAKLRPIARIVRFQKPDAVHLIKRLKDICELENLKADSRSLAALVGATQGDMRGCLNTLQLLKSRHPEITEPIVRRATAGMKESEQSFMGVMTDIFSPLSKSRVKDMNMTSEEESRYVGRMSRAIDSTGTIEKVALACFEFYTSYRIHDANFKAYEEAHEWLATFDLLNGGMRHDREYAIMPYLSYALTPFHPLFSTKGAPKLERPKADWEAFQKQRTNEEIYKTISRNVTGGAAAGRKAVDYRHLVTNEVLQLEFAPLLNRIISPPLRPVNKQVIKPEEKQLMSRVVDIMVSLDLRFIHEKQEDGTLVYRLDPPIDVFVTYDEKRAPDIAVSRYATRHLIAAEIDEHVIIRQAEALDINAKPKVANMFQGRTQAEGSSPTKADREDLQPSSPIATNRKRKRTEAEELEYADRPLVDFFGRLIVQKAQDEVALEAARNYVKVMYKFNEGMSAAVRKPIKMSAFLA